MVKPEDFDDLAAKLGVTDWSLMLVGDGSGTTLKDKCGWACLARWNNPDSPVTTIYGGASCGTNNYAELMPYLHTLWALQSKAGDVRPAKTLIVSDSEVTVRCATGLYGRTANLPLWAMYDWFADRWNIEWRHVRRNSNPLSARADQLAGEVRQGL